MIPELFILLMGTPDKNAKVAELISPVLSGMAFLLSAAAFIFTVIIQLKERRRNLRQTLSTSLSDIARINVEVAKLKSEKKESTTESIKVRKSYNSQRGTLASVADFLIKENRKLVTDADCELMAMTYDDLGDLLKAREYWEQAIRQAPTATQKHLHQRDYAAYHFDHNQESEGRDLFEASLKCDLSDTDDNARYLCDTYLIWASLEKNFGHKEEADRLINEAKAQCARIRHRGKNQEMSLLISQATQTIPGKK